jgi:hypothetical protein
MMGYEDQNINQPMNHIYKLMLASDPIFWIQLDIF